MASTDGSIDTLKLLGEPLCLEFCNTASLHEGEGDRGDRLTTYAALVTWSRRVGTLDAEGAAGLLAAAGRRPREAERVWAEAVALRESIFRLMRAAETGAALPAADLERLSGWATRALSRRVLAPAEGGGVAWRWPAPGDALEAPLWPVAESAASLLCSEALGRVKSCGAADCQWLFLDTSRNRSRRWCDMRDCGNRVKARRHYTRRKGER
ncbi:MAG: CGNR zinc finger domain-containing protein [Gemmatimonadetes bacterium]|nr:CGNR zinc finger domain-containing protein [Gemmatimonadota bacterium]